jgi:hypothetical protein
MVDGSSCNNILKTRQVMPEDLSSIQVSLLKNPYKEMAWLFARVVGQESTATIPRLALYILHFTIHEKTIFDWEKIISGELSFQLSNFKKNKKFYMSSYLIFTITYCHVFKGLHLSKQVNSKIDPVQMWYPSLWKQKAMYHFYEVHNAFVSSFKKLIFGSNTSRLSLEATTFMDKKGSFEAMEHFSIIIVYCSRERPSYLPYYVSDKIFVVEVCRQYRFWACFFHEKRKKQFIPLPWRIGEITLRNVVNIDEFSVQFDQFKLKLANEIKGFDPNQLFMNHMIYVGYSISFANTFLFGEEEGDSQNPQALSIEKKQDDIETVISTTEST